MKRNHEGAIGGKPNRRRGGFGGCQGLGVVGRGKVQRRQLSAVCGPGGEATSRPTSALGRDYPVKSLFCSLLYNWSSAK